MDNSQKNCGGVGGGSGGGSCCGWVRVDVNAMFGVGGDVGYGECELTNILYNVQKGIVQY